MTFKLALIASALGLFAFANGCSSDDHSHTSSSSGEHTSPFPSCQAILDACHELDVGEGPIHDCHETAHDDGTEAKCAAQKDRCVTQVCVKDAGAGDAGEHAH